MIGCVKYVQESKLLISICDWMCEVCNRIKLAIHVSIHDCMYEVCTRTKISNIYCFKFWLKISSKGINLVNWYTCNTILVLKVTINDAWQLYINMCMFMYGINTGRVRDKEHFHFCQLTILKCKLKILENACCHGYRLKLTKNSTCNCKKYFSKLSATVPNNNAWKMFFFVVFRKFQKFNCRHITCIKK